MPNPTLVHPEKKLNHDDVHIEVDGIIINDKQVLKSQEGNVSDIATVAAFTAPATGAAKTVTTNDAADLTTVADALEVLRDKVNTLRTQVVAMNAVLENHGLTADA